MNEEGIKEIRRMQADLDDFFYFANNLLFKLMNPEKEVMAIDIGDSGCNEIWKRVDELQKKLMEYECKVGPEN